MSDIQTFDAIVIGTGQAGPSLASRCANEGLKTAVIEKDKFGGTCVNTGCTPTKAMVASARAAHMAARGADFGIDIPEKKIDFPRVMKRVNDIRNRASTGFQG